MEAKVQAVQPGPTETLALAVSPKTQVQPDPQNAPSDPMEEFSRQLEDIIKTYGSAESLMDKQVRLAQLEEHGSTSTSESISAQKVFHLHIVLNSTCFMILNALTRKSV